MRLVAGLPGRRALEHQDDAATVELAGRLSSASGGIGVQAHG